MERDKAGVKRGYMSGNLKAVLITEWPKYYEQHGVVNYITSCRETHHLCKYNRANRIRNAVFARELFDLDFWSCKTTEYSGLVTSFLHYMHQHPKWMEQ